MNKLIRFKNVVDRNKYDVMIDDRLCLKDNLKLLEEITYLKLHKYYVYDLEKNVFLNKDVPFCEFELDEYKTLYIYPL